MSESRFASFSDKERALMSFGLACAAVSISDHEGIHGTEKVADSLLDIVGLMDELGQTFEDGMIINPELTDKLRSLARRGEA